MLHDGVEWQCDGRQPQGDGIRLLPSSDNFSDKVTERLPGRVHDDSRAEPARLPMRFRWACFTGGKV